MCATYNDGLPREYRLNWFSVPAKTIAVAATLAGTLLIRFVQPCSAATEVSGHPNQMQVNAENASIREVLDALFAKFKVSYKLPPNVSRNVTGHYSGSLRQVLGRILDGNDYIVTVSGGSIEVVVFGASGPTAPGSAVARTESPGIPTTSASSSIAPPSTSPPTTPIVPAVSSPPPLATYLSAPTHR